MVSRKRYQRGASILCGFLSDGRTWNVEIFHALVERTRVEREIFQRFARFSPIFPAKRERSILPPPDRGAKPTKVVSDWLGSWVKARCSRALFFLSDLPLLLTYRSLPSDPSPFYQLFNFSAFPINPSSRLLFDGGQSGV